MNFIATLIISWVVFSLILAIAFSVWMEYQKAKIWTRTVIELLYQNNNVRYDVAKTLVDNHYPIKQVMYSLANTSPAFGATKMFWALAHDQAWRPAHFNDRRLPEVLYTHRTWGGIIVEA